MARTPAISYDLSTIAELFDGMAATYGAMNLLTSFGFSVLWRYQCRSAVRIDRGARVLDLMTGQGELCAGLATCVGATGSVIAVDISAAMCLRAEQNTRRKTGRSTPGAAPVQVLRADALRCPIDNESVDGIFCSFGLKTLDARQTDLLAAECFRLLRPGGQCSFIEISDPMHWPLRWPYLFYLSHCIPLVGRLLLGNPDHYRLLGQYTAAFGNARAAASAFRRAGFRVADVSRFFGCATGFTAARAVAPCANDTTHPAAGPSPCGAA